MMPIYTLIDNILMKLSLNQYIYLSNQNLY